MAAGILAVAATIALAGCSGSTAAKNAGRDSRSAATIAAQMKAAMSSAKSVHIKGTVRESGSSDSLDMAMFAAGGLSGSIASSGTSLEIVEAGHTAYIKVTSAFLKLANAPASVCQKVCGKYVALDPADGQKLIGDLSLTKLLGQFTKDMPTFTKAGTTTASGEQALILHGSDGSVVDVAATGPPYPLRIVAPRSHQGDELDFSQWNAVPAITAPPASQVISLSKLAG